MEAIKPNDIIYTKFGYGVVVDLAAPQKNLEEMEPLALYRGESKIGEVEPECIGEDQTVEVNLNWGGKAYLMAKDLTKVITIKVKIFYGERKMVEITVPIDYTISQLFKLVKEEAGELMDSISNPRFYYPMGYIKSLDSSAKMMSDYKIPDGAQLLMVGRAIFCWGEEKKPKNLDLLNKSLTVKAIRYREKDGSRSRGANSATIMGDTKMSSGRHYWNIKLDYLNRNDDSLSIGICTEELDQCTNPMNSGNYWGFQPIICQKFGPKTSEHYGKSAAKGDVIGVCLEFKNMYGTLSFYKNGKFLGIAETNLVGTFYAAVTFFAPDSQITLDHSSKPLTA